MTRKAKLILGVAGGCLVPLVIVLALAGYVVVFTEYPGGMRPSYPARDHDPRLTREAAKALPLIAAINRYHEEHAAFPVKVADLAAYISIPKPPPAPVPIGDAEPLGWVYTRSEDGSGYSLFLHLGWDPSLSYRYRGSKGQWVFDPGEGSDEKILTLNP